MTAYFSTLIGKFIHHCGALEFLTNNSIRAFAKDPLLSNDAIKSSWSKRISLLQKLLNDRSNINNNDVNNLCDELDEIRKKRNLIAHNPIVSTKPNGSGTEEILIIRHKPDTASCVNKITKEDVAKLVVQTNKLIRRFASLVPDSTKT
ncbi:hypothetical protein ES708_23676 [subsurface metagenome]|jgi:hypothetical protein